MHPKLAPDKLSKHTSAQLPLQNQLYGHDYTDKAVAVSVGLMLRWQLS